ncbi:MAG: patatin-like phospholipase family protein [Candidatus Bipolaricaulota bacterium]|nr:patatin-like phospholipase family protein [Candidatus Bipolaricaulota bacterium]
MGKGHKIGLALGGGGARGFAHLGVLMALEENDIPIDIITGTSMGAAMGAIKALGLNLRKMERLLASLDLNDLLQVSDSTLREMERGIGRGMMEYLRGSSWREPGYIPERLARMFRLFYLLSANKGFSEIVVPFAVVAAELESGARVVLNEGKIYKAVTASAAIPGVFYPVRHEGRYLIDGGVIDKIPADVTVELGAGIVIAVDTSSPLEKRVENSLYVLLQAQRIPSAELTELQLDRVRKQVNGRFILLRPDLEGIGMLAFNHLGEAVQAGRGEALARMDEIKALCSGDRA